VRHATLAAALVLITVPALAQPSTAPAKPKLIVAVSVDQLSADLFAQYRNKVTGGFKRLQSGVVFPSGYQSHAATETCPGHSTILSGVRPATSGLAANDWFGMRGAKFDEIYCVEDENVAGSTHDNYTVSLAHLLPTFQTLGDRLKAQPGSQTRVFAVSGKDRGATLMAGRNADQTWWYDWRARGFTTYANIDQSQSAKAIPALKGVNERIAAWIAKPVAAPPLPASCTSEVMSLPTGKITVGDGTEIMPRVDKVDNTAKDYRISRALDVATLDLAESMVVANGLGQGNGTDVLAIGLSGTDYIGHAYGPQGPEMCAQLASIDARLERLFILLDKRKVDYAVVLTADHGGLDTPDRHKIRAYPAAKPVTLALAAPMLSKMLADQFGWQGSLIENRAVGGDYYFTPAVPAARRAEGAAWLKAALAKSGSTEIEAVFTRADMASVPMPSGNPSLWSIAQRVRASYDAGTDTRAGRSGDIYIVMRHGILGVPASSRGYVSTHGTAWDYDRRVPILFWWRGVKGFEQPMGVETVDILPTLASLVGLDVPAASVDGRCLDLDRTAESNCR
jgi:predicted AlkP superfamily pyrophosphatase or phosphodiesterase